LSPHKNFYAKDQDGNNAYFIEFNIGDFNFDEITIRTEGHRLIVQGKSKVGEDAEEVNREFTRDFTLPNNVDQYSIKAQLDEATRMLSLIGQIVEPEQKEAPSVSAGLASMSLSKLGAIKETKSGNSIEYVIYIGTELANGQCSLELSGYSNLVIRVYKNELDKFGEYNYELKRQIKLPANADSHNIEHGIDRSTCTLFLKVPLT
jgi:HSP20 family molecular chaperone IbpA